MTQRNKPRPSKKTIILNRMAQFGNYVFTFSIIDGIALAILAVIVYMLHFKLRFPLTVTAISTVVGAVLLGLGLVAWAKKYAPHYGLTKSQGLFPVDYFFLEVIVGIIAVAVLFYFIIKDSTRTQNLYLYVIGTGLLTTAVAYFWARDEAPSYGVPSSEVWSVQMML